MLIWHMCTCVWCVVCNLSCGIDLAEEQRQQTAASFSSDSSSTSGPPPQPHSTHQQTHSESSSPPYQPVPVVTRPATRLVYPAANQPLPFPEGFPATKEDVTYLEGINKSAILNLLLLYIIYSASNLTII